MKLGFGFYRHMLTEQYYKFAVQCGATHAVVHLCDYGVGSASEDGADAKKTDQPVGDDRGWGLATHPEIWTVDELLAIKADLADHGLIFHAIENFDPAQWYDVLLDGPRKAEQLEQIKQQIRNVGAAGIPIFGYNFSIAGVAARVRLTTRGDAPAVGLDGISDLIERPMPNGMVWNMVYDPEAQAGETPSASHEQLWQRLTDFLTEIVPVAEEAGVILAAHPDDPPLEWVRRQPRLVYRRPLYQRLLDIVPSPSNQLELCVGTLAEMNDEGDEVDLYGYIERYSRQNKIGYVHLRNVRGQVPHYVETFIDDGEVDIKRVLRILHDNGYDGVVIPDHAPQMSCDAPWHAGMAFALGYIRAKLEDL